jgi:hypothetical protein
MFATGIVGNLEAELPKKDRKLSDSRLSGQGFLE